MEETLGLGGERLFSTLLALIETFWNHQSHNLEIGHCNKRFKSNIFIDEILVFAEVTCNYSHYVKSKFQCSHTYRQIDTQNWKHSHMKLTSQNWMLVEAR